MPISGSMQQVERDALLGGAAVQPERLAVAAHQPDLLVRGDPAERGRPPAEQPQPGVAGQLARRPRRRRRRRRTASAISCGVDVELGHAGPARARDVLAVVLVGGQADRRGLDPQRHVLGDQRDRPARFGGEVRARRPGCGCRCCRAEARPAAPTGRCGSARRAACRPVARSGSARPAGRAGRAGRRACAGPGGRTSRARGGGAWPPARRSRPAGARPRARRSASGPTGRTAGRRCRGRTYGGAPSTTRLRSASRGVTAPAEPGWTEAGRWACSALTTAPSRGPGTRTPCSSSERVATELLVQTAGRCRRRARGPGAGPPARSTWPGSGPGSASTAPPHPGVSDPYRPVTLSGLPNGPYPPRTRRGGRYRR